ATREPLEDVSRHVALRCAAHDRRREKRGLPLHTYKLRRPRLAATAWISHEKKFRRDVDLGEARLSSLRTQKGDHPMRFLSFIRSSESFRNGPPPAALMQAMGPFIEKWKREGVLVDTGGLLPSKDGVRIRSHGGKLSITDGPFAETKEVIG